MQSVYRFVFNAEVNLDDVEETLILAVTAAKGPFGDARVRMHAAYYIDRPSRTLIIDGRSDVGEMIAQVFTAFAIHEYGAMSFSVGDVGRDRHKPAERKKKARRGKA